jgi:hypothetical protein
MSTTTSPPPPLPDGAVTLCDTELAEVLYVLYQGSRRSAARAARHGARKDFFGRELVCTPVGGCYGLAGWVACVNGSPPRGLVLFAATRQSRDFLVYWNGAVPRRLDNCSHAAQVLWRFHAQHLEDANQPFVFHLPSHP